MPNIKHHWLCNGSAHIKASGGQSLLKTQDKFPLKLVISFLNDQTAQQCSLREYVQFYKQECRKQILKFLFYP